MIEISGISLLHSRIGLKTPYDLSFTTVEYIDSLVVRLDLETGSAGFGEVVPLPGYSDETCESLIRDIKIVSEGLVGRGVKDVYALVSDALPHSPFARSAFCVAKEMACGEIDLRSEIDLPIVAPLSSSMDIQDLVVRTEQLISCGYRTLKLKVGRDIGDDLAAVEAILHVLDEPMKLRIDANQAYGVADARRLLELLANHRSVSYVEVVEQPLGVPNWDGFASLVKDFPHLPLMLDESIFDSSDLERAISMGTRFIKLKLFKHRGTKELLALATKAKDAGMGIVLGNGVSTDFSNIIEAGLYRSSLFSGAFEGNGYDKLSDCVLKNAPVTVRGNMVWKPKSPSLDEESSLFGQRYQVIGRWRA